MSYRVRLSVNGVELEVEGDREFVAERLENLEWLENLVERLGGLPKQPGRPGDTPGEKPSFVEFASTIEPKSHPQRFLTVAYYLYKWEDRDITYDDLEEYYRKARWPMPSNPRDVAGDLVRDGFIEDAGRVNGKKAFRILQKGIRFVENGFKEV